ncbi:hypothetical protein ABFS83_12G078600 [Erythranthe nasuta]
MEVEKRKREEDSEAANQRRGKRRDDDGVGLNRALPAAAGDEEVDQFFAILKRVQVAVKYFRRRRDGVRCAGRELTAEPPWWLSFEREDFDGVKHDPVENQKWVLDLNSDPAPDV